MWSIFIPVSLAIVVLVAVLLIIVINIGMVRQLKLKTYIKKHASLKNQPLLLKYLRNAPIFWKGNHIEMTEDKKYYQLLIIPLVTIGMLLYYAIAKPVLADSPIQGIFFIFMIIIVFIQLIVALFFIEEMVNIPKIKLMLTDLVSEDELSLLFTANNEDVTGGCDNSILNNTISYPDEMITFLLNKEKINEYLKMKANLNALTKGKEEFLTAEQRQQNEQIQKEFKKTIEPLKVIIQDFKKATSKSYYLDGQNDKLDISKIQDQFDSLHRETKEKLSKLSEVVPMRVETDDRSVRLPQAIQELNLVVQSKQVSENIKVEAKELIDSILEKESIAKSNQEKEMEEIEALSVIEASKRFYQI